MALTLCFKLTVFFTLSLQYRPASLDCAGRRRGCRGGRLKPKPIQQSTIPVVIGHGSGIHGITAVMGLKFTAVPR